MLQNINAIAYRFCSEDGVDKLPLIDDDFGVIDHGRPKVLPIALGLERSCYE